MGGDWCSEGRGFESRHHILDGKFSYICSKGKTFCLIKITLYFFSLSFQGLFDTQVGGIQSLSFSIFGTFLAHTFFVSILFEIFVIFLAVSFQQNTSDWIVVIILHLKLQSRPACPIWESHWFQGSHFPISSQPLQIFVVKIEIMFVWKINDERGRG